MLLPTSLLLSLLSVLSLAFAKSSNNASAVFVYEASQNTQLVFALNADSNTGDLYFHLESPAGNSWVGVGIGDQMAGALMFIAYPGSNSRTVTISPRIADGNSEPTYQSIMMVKDGATSVTGSGRNQKIEADGVCKGCRTWANGGSIDLSNTKQPFIFAVGPVFPGIASDSKSADLTRHEFYGHFTMDMTAATSNGGAVPLGPYVQKDASAATNTTVDHDPAPHIHGLVMSVVFILLFPLGSLLLRVWNKVKGHMIVQIIALVLFCMAFAGGCVVSQEYNKSKNFNSAHQVIGILLLLAFFSQLSLGLLNHRIFKREQRKTIMGKIHKFLGPTILFFGLVNGAIGFAFAGTPILAIPYVIVVLIFAIIYSCIRGGTWFCRRRRNADKGGPEGYQYPQFGNPQQPYAPPAGAPSGYPPPYSQDVPLTRFASSQSVPQYETQAPQQPRPMV